MGRFRVFSRCLRRASFVSVRAEEREDWLCFRDVSVDYSCIS